MIRCFECKEVNTNVEYVCASGVGDYFCHDCAVRNNLICPLCGSDMVLIEPTNLEFISINNTGGKVCPNCRTELNSDWMYCPYCSRKL